MAIWDLSPGQWVSPGTAKVSLNVILTNMGFDPLPLDIWINDFSPANLVEMPLASGFNAIPVPDVVNQRGVIVIMPRGNTQTWIVKGVTGDTGNHMNPNGFYAATIDPANPLPGTPSALGITTGGIIEGVTFIWW